MADVEIKRRRRTTKQELAILEDLFKSNPNPPKTERARVCQLIDMPPRKLQVGPYSHFFDNFRFADFVLLCFGNLVRDYFQVWLQNRR